MSHRKHMGAYYTPDQVALALTNWVIRNKTDRMLDPSCGDGRFLVGHQNSVGIESDPTAAMSAIARAPGALVHEGEFFTWANRTKERFECAAGNPPFIRYQTFKGEMRDRALKLTRKLGASFSGLSSSWAPFLVVTASLLKRGGRMAFVVPAELGHAPYAAPVIEYLAQNFEELQVIAIRKKLFPELSEDCWLLYADGYGGQTASIALTVLEEFLPDVRPPKPTTRISLSSWRNDWARRLRPLLLPQIARDFYLETSRDLQSLRLGDIARVGIGYVSGANDFFHVRPSQVDDLSIPKSLLHVTVRNGRTLPKRSLTASTVKKWFRNDEPCFLLRLPKECSLPHSVKAYLDTEPGHRARTAYKCRTRSPWYSVPDVQVPNFFLSYMSGRTPSLVQNLASATCTNSVHIVRLHDPRHAAFLKSRWDNPFTQLSCEIEGHPLGGGMLKLEPREAGSIVFPASDVLSYAPWQAIEDGLSTMRQWRHYAN